MEQMEISEYVFFLHLPSLLYQDQQHNIHMLSTLHWNFDFSFLSNEILWFSDSS